MSWHDDILDAFRRREPQILTCDRGGVPGYTHVHGPSQPADATRCHTHWVVVERHNGTVGLRRPLAAALGALPRPLIPITKHPLGYSCHKAFGEFDNGFEIGTLLDRWATLDAFVRDVIERCRTFGSW
jgi:hypothetical protein